MFCMNFQIRSDQIRSQWPGRWELFVALCSFALVAERQGQLPVVVTKKKFGASASRMTTRTKLVPIFINNHKNGHQPAPASSLLICHTLLIVSLPQVLIESKHLARCSLAQFPKPPLHNRTSRRHLAHATYHSEYRAEISPTRQTLMGKLVPTKRFQASNNPRPLHHSNCSE
jgi:hypothetical protein